MNPAAGNRRARGRTARAVGLAASLLVGLILAGCGLGPGKDTGEASLLVTRDYGSKVLADKPDIPANESSNAMRILDESADLETRYGGDFVQTVDGLSGGAESGRSFDWFFSVNGVVAERGSAQFPVEGGDVVWWDYRDWTDAMDVGAVVGAYPAPFSTGYDGRDWGVEVDCLGDRAACRMVTNQLKGDGVVLKDAGKNMKLLVGTYGDLADTSEMKKLQHGPRASGVFARFEPDPGVSATGGDTIYGLVGLDVRADEKRDFGPDAGLVAGMRRADDPPVWLITGGTADGVQMAAAALNPEDLERRYAAVISDRQVSSLPVP